MEIFYLVIKITAFIVFVYILLFLLEYFFRSKKLIDLLILAEIEKGKLIDFIEINKNEFYLPETIAKMEEIENTIKDVKQCIEDLKKTRKQKINRQTECIVNETKSKTGFHFDPFGIDEYSARSSTNFQLKVAYFSCEMELRISKIKFDLAHSFLFYNGIRPEIKKRKDLIEKFENYLQQELSYCRSALKLKAYKRLNHRIKMINYFLDYLKSYEVFESYRSQFTLLKT